MRDRKVLKKLKKLRNTLLSLSPKIYYYIRWQMMEDEEDGAIKFYDIKPHEYEEM